MGINDMYMCKVCSLHFGCFGCGLQLSNRSSAVILCSHSHLTFDHFNFSDRSTKRVERFSLIWIWSQHHTSSKLTNVIFMEQFEILIT